MMEALKEKEALLEDELKRRSDEQSRGYQRLRAMEAKMLEGSKAMHQALQQEQELRKAKRELDDKSRRQRQLQDDMEKKDEERLVMEEKYQSQYQSQEDQLHKQSAKLKKLWTKYRAAVDEISDLQQVRGRVSSRS
eukprot:GHVU01051430.1.p2 GENE.GHVU01051430.1~~GHVU01051430.1.p2  ORF type:complete len:136 (+),score=41.89 GHVU01051430.1:681-1088(+)